MPRPRRFRRIFFTPPVNYFKPAGIPLRNLQEVILTLPESESIRLIDLEEIEQKKAAEKMKISQPTLSRLIKSARKKIALAITKGYAIKIQGGKFQMANQTFPRRRQGRGGGGRFRAPQGGAGRMQGDKAGAGPSGNCVCPKCGHEEPHQVGQPCNQKSCPKCGTRMTRE